MPYSTPPNLFDDIEKNVWKEIGKDAPTVPKRKLAAMRIVAWSTAIAASLALMAVINMKPKASPAAKGVSVEQAFANLSAEDQAYLLEVYQDDIFITE